RPEAAFLDGANTHLEGPARKGSEALDFDISSVEDHGADMILHGTLTTQPSVQSRLRAQKAPGAQTPGGRPNGRHRIRLAGEGLLFFGADGKRLRDRAAVLSPAASVLSQPREVAL